MALAGLVAWRERKLALQNRSDTASCLGPDFYAELDSDYDGVDVTVRKRLSNRWMLLGGMNVGRNRGDIYGTADLNNPNFTFREGVLAQDVPSR